MVSVLHLFRFHWFSGVTKTDLIAGTLLWVQPVRQEGWILPLSFCCFCFCFFGACHWLRLTRVSNSAWNLEWECIAAAFWKYKRHAYFFFPFSYLCLIEVEDTNLPWCWNWFFSPRAGIAHSSPPYTQMGNTPDPGTWTPFPPPLPQKGQWVPMPLTPTLEPHPFGYFQFSRVAPCITIQWAHHPNLILHASLLFLPMGTWRRSSLPPGDSQCHFPWCLQSSLQRIRCLRVQPFLLHNFLRSYISVTLLTVWQGTAWTAPGGRRGCIFPFEDMVFLWTEYGR